MEYVEGRTLRDVLRGGPQMLPERALEITAGVLRALDYSHRAGIVHRDIKPANVMLTPAGEVKVMDFGIARAIADTSATMTQTAAVIGTAQYLSPEQARGEPVDARSDLYSTGCLLYELLTGRPPFVGDSPVSVAYQHVREQAAPPSVHDPGLSPEVDAIVMRALRRAPTTATSQPTRCAPTSSGTWRVTPYAPPPRRCHPTRRPPSRRPTRTTPPPSRRSRPRRCRPTTTKAAAAPGSSCSSVRCWSP